MFFLLILELLLCGALSEFTPPAYPAKIVSSKCSHYNHFDEQLTNILRQIKQQLSVQNTSCKSILDNYPSAPSGCYHITTTNGSSVQVYCDMEGTNCGGEGGWTRVAYVNMTQPGATCPQRLHQRVFGSQVLCTLTVKHGCNGTVFHTPVEYSKVCGQVRGYQYSSLTAFYSYNTNNGLTINEAYVDGVSITYGSAPRKHIWTYAGGAFDKPTDSVNFNCPCKNDSIAITPPYVGTDYYCESGVNVCCPWNTVVTANPLWDGQQCGGGEASCCTNSNMPWFIKILNETTTEDIEVKLCKIGKLGQDVTGDTPLDLIELFVR